MFTVKHMTATGGEFALEARSYEAYTDEYGKFRFMTYDSAYRDGNYTGLWAGSPRHGAAPGVDTIYVMNSAGSTTACHHFDAGVQDGVGCAAQADLGQAGTVSAVSAGQPMTA